MMWLEGSDGYEGCKRCKREGKVSPPPGAIESANAEKV